MPQEDDGGGQMQKLLKVLGMVFVAHDQAAEVEQPGKEPLDLPAPPVTTQWPAILPGHPPVDSVGRDQFGAVVRQQPRIQPVAVVGLVANQPLRHVRHDALLQRGLDTVSLLLA